MAGSVMVRLCIVPAGVAHCDVLAALHGSACEDSWSAATFAALLATPGCFAFLAERASQRGAPPVPLGLILCRAAGGECEILTLAVPPPARRQGVGRALLRAALAAAAAAGAHAVFLEVAEHNRPAERLYASEGFGVVGRRKAYYRQAGAGEAVDALVLRRDVGGEAGEKR